MRIVSNEEINNVLHLSGEKKYKYFLNFVCDSEKAWGLYNDGWALAADDNGQVVFPLWPAKLYAKMASADKWADYKPKSISLKNLVEKLAHNLDKDLLLFGVFYTPNNKGIVISPLELAEDICNELEKY